MKKFLCVQVCFVERNGKLGTYLIQRIIVANDDVEAMELYYESTSELVPDAQSKVTVTVTPLDEVIEIDNPLNFDV